ncbi:hypothetical protein Tco_0566913 [Tanacetum coccineum]
MKLEASVGAVVRAQRQEHGLDGVSKEGLLENGGLSVVRWSLIPCWDGMDRGPAGGGASLWGWGAIEVRNVECANNRDVEVDRVMLRPWCQTHGLRRRYVIMRSTSRTVQGSVGVGPSVERCGARPISGWRTRENISIDTGRSVLLLECRQALLSGSRLRVFLFDGVPVALAEAVGA